MVLDNADDLNMFFTRPTSSSADIGRTKPLANYLPRNSQGLMMITTRDNRIGERLAGRHASIIVRAMSPPEAQKLLRSQVEQSASDDNDDSRKLTDALECIPLAITQAAAFISQNSISLAEYLDLFNKNDSELQSLLDEDAGDLRRGLREPKLCDQDMETVF